MSLVYPPYLKSDTRRTFNPDAPIALTVNHSHGYVTFELTISQAEEICAKLGSLIEDVQRAGYYGNQSDDRGNRVETKT